MFLHNITFSPPLYDGDVKFCRRIRKEPNKNQILCRQGILGWDQVIFTMSGVKESKNTCDPVFPITKKMTGADRCRHQTTAQGAKPLLQLTFIRP